MTQLPADREGPVTGPQGTVVVPLIEHRADRSRPVGILVIDADGEASFIPVVDVQRLAWCAAAGLVAAVLAIAAGHGRGPSIGAVRMGPGGWISLKGAAPARLLPQRRRHRPWWARLLRAHRLVVE